MRNWIYIFIPLLLLGCSENYTYSPLNSHSFMIDLPKGTIDRVKVVDWKVGRGKSLNKISKGILVSLNIPSLSKEHLKDINKKTEVDSWLIKVSKISRTGNKTILGHITLPLVQKNWRKSSNGKFFREIKKILYYQKMYLDWQKSSDLLLFLLLKILQHGMRGILVIRVLKELTPQMQPSHLILLFKE